jgi:hypothetical protein
MKITKKQLKQIIKEELGAMRENDEETGPDLSYEEQEQFMAAYQEIDGSELSESTKEAVFNMLHRLGMSI